MPGYGLCQVKCEPLSEEEDSNSQCFSSYTDNQNAVSELVPIKLEPEPHNEDHVPSHLLQHLQASGGLLELEAGAPAGPAATPVRGKLEPHDLDRTTLATLQSTPNATSSSLLERHMALGGEADIAEFVPLLPVKDEPLSDGEQGGLSGDEARGARGGGGSPKSWTQKDMDQALDALKNHNMSLTKASARYGIPSTTLWQRAHRLGIDTPKKDGGAKSWGDGDLRRALAALRAGLLSANKASKAYGIPSSTLYKIARREGIRLAAPFNAAPVSWRRADLDAALADIRRGAASVQRAAVAYGIPTGTLYGRCKREGIELSRANPTPWSEDAMGEALEAVRVGQMSINQAAIHYNLPYSSLYGRFKRCKYQPQGLPSLQDHQDPQKPHEMEPHGLDLQQYYHHPGPHIIHHMPDDSQDQGIRDHNDSHDHMNSHHTGPQNQAELLQPGSQTLGPQDHIGLQNQVPQDHRAHEIQLREDHTHYLPHMALDPMHMVHEYSPGQSMYYASCNMAS